jgi:hypothetical protein
MADRRNAHAVRSIDSVGKIAHVTRPTTNSVAGDFAHPTAIIRNQEEYK